MVSIIISYNLLNIILIFLPQQEVPASRSVNAREVSWRSVSTEHSAATRGACSASEVECSLQHIPSTRAHERERARRSTLGRRRHLTTTSTRTACVHSLDDAQVQWTRRRCQQEEPHWQIPHWRTGHSLVYSLATFEETYGWLWTLFIGFVCLLVLFVYWFIVIVLIV